MALKNPSVNCFRKFKRLQLTFQVVSTRCPSKGCLLELAEDGNESSANSTASVRGGARDRTPPPSRPAGRSPVLGPPGRPGGG
jgi:hypothetical protein